MMTIHWSQFQLDARATQLDRAIYPDFNDISSVDLTDEFFTDLKRRCRAKKMNLILDSFGKQRSGKSYAMIFIAEKTAQFLGTELKIENVVFRLDDALSIVEKLDRRDIIMLDEQVYTAGSGSEIERRKLVNIERTVGAHELFLFFLAPEFIRHAFHFYTQTWQMGSARPWDFNSNWTEQWQYTKSLIYNNNQQLLGFIITGRPKDADFLAKYEKKKDRAIEEFRKGITTGRYGKLLKDVHAKIKEKNFTKTWMQLRTKNVKILYLQSIYAGKMIPTEQMKQLCDYIDLYLKTGIIFGEKV